MQIKETTAKKIGRPGFTDKRFWIKNEHVKAVSRYASIVFAKDGEDLNWVEALHHLVETHPVAKKFL